MGHKAITQIFLACRQNKGPARLILRLTSLTLLIAGCSIRPYHAVNVDSSSFLDRSHTQELGPIQATAAVPDASETAALTGLDLYEQGIQPVWLRIENRAKTDVRLATWSIDRNYFAPIEVAYMNRKKFSKQGYKDMERWFYENSIPRQIPAGESRSGLVYTYLKPGTKAFNLDIFSNQKAHNFTFFIPMPGFTADYTQVDFASLYSEDDIRNLSEHQLKLMLENELPCCSSDASGEKKGSPLNAVLVGSSLAVRRAMMRGDWQETSAKWRDDNIQRNQYFDGRRPDAVFYQDRDDGNETIELRLWLSRWQVDSQPVWIGQTFYAINDTSFWAEVARNGQFQDSTFLASFLEENVAADLDGAQNFILQNFWYNQSLEKMGLTGGVGKRTVEQPGTTYNGLAYFTDGNRVVLFVSESPTGLDEVDLVFKDMQAIAAGDDDV